MRVIGEAGDGEQALETARALMRAGGLDLVLVDLELPRLTGLATIERLSAEHPELALVTLTASTDEADMVEAIRLGAVGFLSKHLAQIGRASCRDRV